MKTRRDHSPAPAAAPRGGARAASGAGPIGALQRLADGSAATRRLGAMSLPN